MLTIVDIGLGNVASVRNMLVRLGYTGSLRATPDGLAGGDQYILPGVWSCDEGARRLRASGWNDHLHVLPQATRVLGIFLGSYFSYPIVKRMTPVRPLNLMPYSKEHAASELEQIGWRAYPRKHGESLFTKFFQNYYLPTKFGYDKRRPHLSSRIASGEITRGQALHLLSEPLYDEEELRRDRQYLCRKLRISDTEFEDLMNRPTHHYTDFDNWDKHYIRLKKLQTRINPMTGKTVACYR